MMCCYLNVQFQGQSVKVVFDCTLPVFKIVRSTRGMTPVKEEDIFGMPQYVYDDVDMYHLLSDKNLFILASNN